MLGQVVLAKKQLGGSAQAANRENPNVFEIDPEEGSGLIPNGISRGIQSVKAGGEIYERVRDQENRDGKEQEGKRIKNPLPFTPNIAGDEVMGIDGQVLQIEQEPFVHIGKGRKEIRRNGTKRNPSNGGLFPAIRAKFLVVFVGTRNTSHLLGVVACAIREIPVFSRHISRNRDAPDDKSNHFPGRRPLSCRLAVACCLNTICRI